MKIIKNLYVSGYRSYELGVFTDDDEKIFYIKEFLKSRLSSYIESGVEWIITTGQLGVEIWTCQAVQELKEDYPEVRYAILMPHLGFGEKWNEKNKGTLMKIVEQADYVNYTSNMEYKHPGQLRGNQQFVLNNTDGALLVYDAEAEGKPVYLYNQIVKYQEKSMYELETVSFDELQDFVTEYQEVHQEEW